MEETKGTPLATEEMNQTEDSDLDDSKRRMEQVALEMCIRRTKREALRQKWEVVDNCEAVSERSHRSISTKATDTKSESSEAGGEQNFLPVKTEGTKRESSGARAVGEQNPSLAKAEAVKNPRLEISEEVNQTEDSSEDTRSESFGPGGERRFGNENVKPQISQAGAVVHLALEEPNEKDNKQTEDTEDAKCESLQAGGGQNLGNENMDKPLVPTSTVVHLTLEELDARLKREREAVEVRMAKMEKLVKQDRKEVDVMMESLMKRQEASCILHSPKDVEGQEHELMQLVEARANAESQCGEEGQNWHETPETVYTVMYICKIQSQSFFYAVVVYVTQMATICLTLVDILDPESDDNPLQLPPMVDPTVTWAQGVTIFMALAYQSDLIEAVLKLQDGFHPEILEQQPGATFFTWLISGIAQLMAGLLLLVTIFILTMQVDSVLAIMLNFAALHFMAEIDDYGFVLASMGFVTNKIQREVQSVVVKIPLRPTRNRSRRILYFLSLAGLFIGYGMLKGRQLSGQYLPTFVYVQFGDAYNPKIPYFSGILTSGNVRTFSHRTYTDVETGFISLGYCQQERSWTFSEVGDPCIYFAKSHETESYDVTTIADENWQVFDSIGRLQPFDSFSLVSRDCNSMACQGKCSSNGICECPHDCFGMDCEFFDVCPELVVDGRFEPFPPVRINLDLVSVSGAFQLLQNDVTQECVKVYHMPVYYSNSSFPANVLFFGGRRWVLTSEWDLFNLTEATLDNPSNWFFKDRTISVLQNDFHGYHQANYTPFFISDPVDFETPDFHPTPVGLEWWTVELQNNKERHFVPDVPFDTLLACRNPQPCIGKATNFCGTGECNIETGLCECDTRLVYYGDQCELVKPCTEQIFPCLGNGFCDESSGFCLCNLPYFGKVCEAQYKCYEEGGRCHNGGVCDEISGMCSCPEDPAISGVACEKRADCAIFGCASGGKCGWNGNCVCRPPFHGTNCDLVDTTQLEHFCLSEEDCANGKCNSNTGICECEDPRSYGTLCEYTYDCSEYDEWGKVTCLNSGTCNATSGVCDCPKPYFGPDCSKISLCSNDEDCGGKRCDLETGLCTCSDVRSEIDRCTGSGTCFSQEDCHNGGTCDGEYNCRCASGYGSRFCDTIITGMYSPRWDWHNLQLEQNVTLCGFDDPTCDLCWEEDPPSYCLDL